MPRKLKTAGYKLTIRNNNGMRMVLDAYHDDPPRAQQRLEACWMLYLVSSWAGAKLKDNTDADTKEFREVWEAFQDFQTKAKAYTEALDKDK